MKWLLSLLIGTAGMNASAAGIFADFSSATDGTLNGVAFTVSSSGGPGYHTTATVTDLSGADFNPSGSATQSALSYSCGQTMTITFAEQVSGLSLHLVYWRGGGSAGPTDGTYNLSATPTFVSGVKYSTSGNSVIVSSDLYAYAMGTVTFLDPITTLTITPDSGGSGSSQLLALSTVPEPAQVAVVSGLGLVGFALFRRKRITVSAEQPVAR